MDVVFVALSPVFVPDRLVAEIEPVNACHEIDAFSSSKSWTLVGTGRSDNSASHANQPFEVSETSTLSFSAGVISGVSVGNFGIVILFKNS